MKIIAAIENLVRGPANGAEVAILAGVYAGQKGRITATYPDGTFLVEIDSCCQQVVEASDIRVTKGPGFADRIDGGRREIERNPDAQHVAQEADTNVPFGTRPF